MSLLKQLREMSGCDLIDCKNALKKADNDLHKAMLFLQTQNKTKIIDRNERETTEGIIHIEKTNPAHHIMIQLLCETDFVAKSDEFQALAEKICQTNDTYHGKLINEASNKFGEKIVIGNIHYGIIPDGIFDLYSYVHTNRKSGVILLYEKLVKDVSEQLPLDICLQIVAMKPKYVKEVPEDKLKELEILFHEQTVTEGKPEKVIDKIVDGKIKKYVIENCLLYQEFIKEKMSIMYLIENKISIKSFVIKEV